MRGGQRGLSPHNWPPTTDAKHRRQAAEHAPRHLRARASRPYSAAAATHVTVVCRAAASAPFRRAAPAALPLTLAPPAAAAAKSPTAAAVRRSRTRAWHQQAGIIMACLLHDCWAQIWCTCKRTIRACGVRSTKAA